MRDGWVEAAFEAARAGDLEGLERLLDEAPEGVDARGDHGTVLLHVAAERDDVPMVEMLLDRGATVDLESTWGQTPFEWAANINAQAAAQVLLDRGASGLNAWTAAALGMVEELERQVDETGTLPSRVGRVFRSDVRADGWTAETAYARGDHLSDALYIACRNGRLEAARMLRSLGGNPNARGYFGAPIVHWAAAGGHGELVDWLVSEGADPKVKDPKFDGDAASWAREFGHVDLALRIERLVTPPDAGAR